MFVLEVADDDDETVLFEAQAMGKDPRCIDHVHEIRVIHLIIVIYAFINPDAGRVGDKMTCPQR